MAETMTAQPVQAPLGQSFRLAGRVAFVSGAAGHLGRAMVRTLAEAGAHVILNGRNEMRLKDFQGDLARNGHACERACFDMADAAAVRRYFGNRSRIDILVNNAISMAVRPFAELSPEDFDATYRSSVTATFEAVRAAKPALLAAAREAGEASIVNIASMYGTVAPDSRLYTDKGQQSPFHYGPAKAALLQLTRHLAAELGPHRIRVNALVPGPFPRAEVQAQDPEFAERLAARTMLARLGEAGEIRGPLLFLASPASSFVTGAAIPVDGGWTAW
jgi:NAD(P)-dependent dehydrogenase (short-subunit alcohol dehydrogenase family)